MAAFRRATKVAGLEVTTFETSDPMAPVLVPT
jgi:hypothetical protein